MDFIFFSDDRSGIPTSSMHLADQLSKTENVFWLNTYTRMPKISIGDFSKALRILRERSGKPKSNGSLCEEQTNIRYFTPPVIPCFRKPFRAFNKLKYRKFLDNLLTDNKIDSPVLISTFPCTVDAFEAVRTKTVQIYYCVDEWSEYPGLNPDLWKSLEREMLSVVDGAVFTSRDLESKKKGNLPSLYLPHGVDFEHFCNDELEKTSLSEMESIKKPIVGFFGTIDTWVDISVIAYLGKRFPDISFVLIGRSLVSTVVFDGLDNVHFLGPKPYAELPKYTKYFDVSLIPFVMNDLTKAVNPLKLMEYFAMGTPVISSRLPDILDVPGPLYFADTHEEFGDQLEKILASDLEQLRTDARKVARENSWSKRTEELMEFVKKLKLDV